jgi:hypothetical protein
MHDNISYIEDEVEIARRNMPPPPAEFLAPPAFLETTQDKEERQRQQKFLDEARKRKQDKYEAYQDDFAKDFPKGTSHFFRDPLSPTSNAQFRTSPHQQPT